LGRAVEKDLILGATQGVGGPETWGNMADAGEEKEKTEKKLPHIYPDRGKEGMVMKGLRRPCLDGDRQRETTGGTNVSEVTYLYYPEEKKRRAGV